MIDVGKQSIAVDIGALHPEAFDWKAVEQGCDLTRLPTRRVSATTRSDRSAVLSWRWDRDLYEGRSRNVALALAHSRSLGLDSLFLDFVSIDQSLTGDALMDQVVALGELYSTIDVIAAYDRVDTEARIWNRTLLRPWIFFEQRAYSVGRRNITYVGFQNGIDGHRDHAFANELHDLRTRSAAPNVLGVMAGEIGMANPKDFSRILPRLRSVLERLDQELPRNDYLMSTFVLLARVERQSYAGRGGERRAMGYELPFHRVNFDYIKFTRFALGKARSPSAYQFESDIFFDQTPIGAWSVDESTNRDRHWIRIEPNADEVILEGIGFSERDIEEYRRELANSEVGSHSSSGNPSVREVVANIPARAWQGPPKPRYKTRGFNPSEWE